MAGPSQPDRLVAAFLQLAPAQALTSGLRRVSLVLAPGEVSARGDVVDLLPMAQEHAVRLEFLGGQLESIRTFEPASQRALAVHQDYVLALGPGQAPVLGPVLAHVM